MAPLLPGMEQPPHPMRLGDDEKDYYLREPGGVVGRVDSTAPVPAPPAAEPTTPGAPA
jgi:NADH-quinone oxidoreductase subunit I